MLQEKQYARMSLDMLLLEASQIGQGDELVGALARKITFLKNITGKMDAAKAQIEALIMSYES